MTFSAVETSEQDGQRVELYLFRRGASAFYYTSADHDVTYASKQYLSRALSRSAIESTAEMGRSKLTIQSPRDFEIADLFRAAAPGDVVTLTLLRLHEDDGEAVTIWNGRITSARWFASTAEMTGEPVYTSMLRYGLRKAYTRQCPHVLYSGECGVNKTSYAVAGTVSGINGLDLTISQASAYANGYFAGGMIEYQPTTGVFERRFIRSHTGTTITLPFKVHDLVGGESVTLYPGCDQTTATCESKFNNLLNHGGWPFIPTKNPFGGAPLY